MSLDTQKVQGESVYRYFPINRIIESPMTEFQNRLMKFLEKFDAFCQEHGVEYCLMWGTLLGCIREKGFIPWDDDVDVVMNRTNFEKFKQLASENKLPEGFAFEDSFFLKGCRVPKVRDKRDPIRDRNGGEGIFIDIFPFDRFTAFDVFVLEFAEKGLYAREFRWKIHNKPLRSIYTVLSLIPYLCFAFVRMVYSKRKCDRGQFVGKAVITNTEGFFSFDDFYPFVKKRFETMDLPVPHGYDSILKKLYGNYWVPVNYNNNHY